MSVATATVPTVAHAPINASGLSAKVSINGLDFYYGTAKALKGISLSLYENKVTAFIGPSGCGKSTLLRVLNRMYDLYPGQRAEGQVLLDGSSILEPRLDRNLLRARVGMVFQKPTRSRCRSTTISPLGLLSTTSWHAANSMAAWRMRCAVPPCGMR